MKYKFKYKKGKIQNGLRLLGLMGLAGLIGACAYDPAEKSGKNRVESQSRNLSNEVPFDLVVADRLVLTSVPEKIRRLTILEGAVLSTNGQELKLDIQELVSDNGIIDTTPITPVPRLGASGLSGGLLQINAQHARGRLTVIAGGQNGGAGRKRINGKHPRPAVRGGNGGDSSPVLFKLTDPSDLLISVDASPGKGSMGGKDGSEKPICLRLGEARIGECNEF